MKKLYAFIAAFLAVSFSYAVNVTFTVNMSNETVSANGVHVAGNFDANGSTGTAWDPSAYTMTDNGGGYYSTTIDLNPGMYEFKFINDNGWGGVESTPAGSQVGGGNDNRYVYVDAAMNVDTVCFGGLVDCNKVGVVFQVNMSLETVSGAGVHVAGNFQGWDPSTTLMRNPAGGNFYKYIYAATAGESIEFKYVNGDLWGDDESINGLACTQNNNRFMNSVSADTLYPNVCFGACDPCATKSLTLQVDMSNETVSPDGVHVAGSFQGWDPAGTPMTDMGNGIYEVTLDLQPQGYQYKFVNGNAWGSEESIPAACNVGGNREVAYANDTTVLFCYASCTHPCPTFPDSSNITFEVQIADTLTVSTDADSGGVWLMGGMTSPSWQAGAIKMDLVDATNNIYATTLKLGGSTEIQYKYVLGKPNTTLAQEESGDFLTGGCGIDNPVSTPNRIFERTASDSTICYYFNTCESCSTDSTNSINEIALASIKVYPNPFSDVATISFEQTGNYQIQLMDITGKMVVQMQSSNRPIVELSADGLKNGLYFLNIVDESGLRRTEKLIIQ